MPRHTLSKDDWRDCSRPRYLNGHDHNNDENTLVLTFASQSEAEQFMANVVKAGLLKMAPEMADA